VTNSFNIEGRKIRTVRVKVSPAADFRGVLHAFDAIEIPPTRIGPDNLKFAILELVNNSLRAHRERADERDILVDLTVTPDRLHISVRDFGGGFDPRILPFPLDADPASLDIHAKYFQDYQTKHGYTKFGMGIYLAKKTFDHFQLLFIDGSDLPVSWSPGKISGTLIKADLSIWEDHNGK
jgi:light-regulated signal transduction histidine kinase (bacteriophytochrome)